MVCFQASVGSIVFVLNLFVWAKVRRVTLVRVWLRMPLARRHN